MGINLAATVMAVAVVVATVTGSAAQTLSCATNLIGCQPYLNSTATPPESCCGPLKEAATKDLSCLCGIFNNTAVLKAYGVDIKQAIQMAKRCGVSTDQTACASAPAASTSTPPSSQNNTGSAGDKSTNSAHGMMPIGLLGLGSLQLWMWSLIL